MITKHNVKRLLSAATKRLAELQKERAKAVKEYEASVARWRNDLISWCDFELSARVRSLRPIRVKERYGRHHRLNYDVDSLFTSAPAAPEYPTYDHLRRLQAFIRQLKLTSQATIEVSTREMSVLLGDGESVSED